MYYQCIFTRWTTITIFTIFRCSAQNGMIFTLFLGWNVDCGYLSFLWLLHVNWKERNRVPKAKLHHSHHMFLPKIIRKSVIFLITQTARTRISAEKGLEKGREKLYNQPTRSLLGLSGEHANVTQFLACIAGRLGRTEHKHNTQVWSARKSLPSALHRYTKKAFIVSFR